MDGHFIVRCDHEAGHTIPGNGWGFAQDWMMAHEYGVDSPIEADGIEQQESWCRVVE